jgi:hypothetical protein
MAKTAHKTKTASKSSIWKKCFKFWEKLVNLFNLIFFLVSIAIWIYLTILNLASQPFEFGLLWAAFNQMYGQLSFKVGCIVLIVFNGLQTIRGLIFEYYEIKEYGQHISTLSRLIKKKPQA